MRCSHLVGEVVDSFRASKHLWCGGGYSNFLDDVQNMGSQLQIHCNDRIARRVFLVVGCKGVSFYASAEIALEVCVQHQRSECGCSPLAVLANNEGESRINADPLWSVKAI